MGTRGLFGFYYEGIYYLVYNQFDSYFEGLGLNLIKEIKLAIKEGRLNEWKDRVKMLKIVTNENRPTEEELKKLNEFTDLGVSTKSTNDWYCLLRKCQGSYERVLKSGFVFSSGYSENQLVNDLFIEYSYVLDFDNNKFKWYRHCGSTGEININDIPDSDMYMVWNMCNEDEDT